MEELSSRIIPLEIGTNRLASRLAALLLLAGDYPAAASRPFDRAQDRPFDFAQDRLAIQPAGRALGRVQPPFLGSSIHRCINPKTPTTIK
jgi:hypothetical protein